MKQSQAATLVGMLQAAYPRAWTGEATTVLYMEFIGLLHNAEAARLAVRGLIEERHVLPTIADIRREYMAVMSRPEFRPKELPEPELTSEQRQENVRRMRALLDRVHNSIKSP